MVAAWVAGRQSRKSVTHTTRRELEALVGMLDGLMTIGAPGDFSCFDALVRCREEVADALGVEVDSLDLSMGMSGDYESAIERGATSVRVGSTIFGARDYSNLNK